MSQDPAEKLKKCLSFLEFFESTLQTRPGMLGSVADISAMFYVVDQLRNIAQEGKPLSPAQTWTQFLVSKKLLRDLQPIPIQDNWSHQQLAALRQEYLAWLEVPPSANGQHGA